MLSVNTLSRCSQEQYDFQIAYMSDQLLHGQGTWSTQQLEGWASFEHDAAEQAHDRLEVPGISTIERLAAQQLLGICLAHRDAFAHAALALHIMQLRCELPAHPVRAAALPPLPVQLQA